MIYAKISYELILQKKFTESIIITCNIPPNRDATYVKLRQITPNTIAVRKIHTIYILNYH